MHDAAGSASTVAVVGAGFSGLVAATGLAASGRSVRVIDKGRSVGGRLATRRIGDATLDHGAQFFTVRSTRFAGFVEEAVADGVVYEWCRGFAESDGHPRYATTGGMNRLAKWLATDLEITVDTRIESITNADGQWLLHHPGGHIAAGAVVLTAPMPQALALLDAGCVAVAAPVRARMAAIRYHPTIGVLVLLDRPSAVPHPGGAQRPQGPFGFVADNAKKGISSGVGLTLHLTHELSVKRWDDDPDIVLAEMLEAARPWIGPARVVEAQIKHWRYAQPIDPLPQPVEVTEVGGAPLVFAGDAFAGSKIEGAFLSGAAAADHLVGVDEAHS